MINIEINAHYLIFWTQIYNCLAAKVIYTNKASSVAIILYILGLSFNFFSDSRTLKFLKVKCNPVNKKIVAKSILLCFFR